MRYPAAPTRSAAYKSGSCSETVKHEHLRAAARSQSRARAQTVDARHLEIEQHHVRSPALGEPQRLGAVGGEPDHLDALVRGEQRRRALPHQPVIVDDKNANRHRTPTVA